MAKEAEFHFLKPFTFDNGYSLTAQVLSSNDGGPGVKLELASPQDEAAIILPPDTAEGLRKWLFNAGRLV
jgi:hypothetical protein